MANSSTLAQIPLWQKALNTFNTPIDWFTQHVAVPTAATITAPFTPGLPGGRRPGESPLAYSRRQYEQWQEPVVATLPNGYKVRPFKGLAEQAAWAAPSLLSGGAGLAAKGLQVVGKAGMASNALTKAASGLNTISSIGKVGKTAEEARGVAGALGQMGKAGRVAGYAAQYSPWGLAEAATGKAIELAGKGVGKLLPKPPAIYDEIATVHNTKNGSTFNPAAGNLIGKKFFAVSTNPERTQIINGKEVSASVLHSYAKRNADLLNDGKHSLGSWYNEATGKTELDIVTTVKSKAEALDLAGANKQAAVFDLKTGQTIYATPKQEVTLTHYGLPKTAKTISPRFAGTGQAGSEAKFRSEYGDQFANGTFASRSYYYTPEQTVEPRFAGKSVTTVSESLRVFDTKKAAPEEITRFNDKVLELTGQMRKKFGQNFGGTAQQAQEIRYAAAKELGYEAVNTGDFVAVFKDLKVGAKTGEEIAAKLGVKFQGKYPDGKNSFIDPVTGANISGTTTKEVAADLARVRASQPVNPVTQDLSQAEIDKIIAQKQGGAVPPQVPPPPVRTGSPLPPPPGGAGGNMPPLATPPTETPLAKLIRLLKAERPATRETLRIRQAEHAQRGAAYEEKLQEALAKGNTPEQADAIATRALAGKYTTKTSASAEALRNSMTVNDVQDLFGQIANHDFGGMAFDRKNAFLALQNALISGQGLQLNQIAILEKVFGADLAKALLGKQTLGQKIVRQVGDLANAPRALLASGDLSGLMRQGGVLFWRNPGQGVKAFRPMVEAMLSDGIIRGRMSASGLITARDAAVKYGLFHAELPSQIGVAGSALTQAEEGFASRFLNKLGFVRGSNRAYTTVLNDMRSRSFFKVVDGWEKRGVDFGEQDLKELARLVNWSSGRGDFPFDLGKHSGALSTIFFSPRRIMSRLQLPTAVLHSVNSSSLVRKEAWKTFAAFAGEGAGILAMAQMARQGTVELDPRSPDFGKLKVGNVRLDIWTGYAQYMRFVAQLVTAQSKSPDGQLSARDRRDLIIRLSESKLSPAAGLVNDLLKGQTFLGESFPPKTTGGILGQLYQRMMPLAAQDIIDGVTSDGIMGGLVSGAGMFGIGIATYTDKVRQVEDQAAEERYGMKWDEVGQTYGKAAQISLAQSDPRIVEAQKTQDAAMAGTKPTVMQQYRNQGKAIEQTYRDAINLAAQEFDATGDGKAFRTKVEDAANARRVMYGSRAGQKEYQTITDYYNKPLTPQQVTQMNPLDIARIEYQRMLFGADMYDKFGNYDFQLAAQKEDQFIRQYGQSAADYISAYSSSLWTDKPEAMKQLDYAKDLLSPYFQIEDQVWSQYAPEIRSLSDQIIIAERTDPRAAKLMLRQHPEILMARRVIALQKQQMRRTNPAIQQAYNMFYSF
jgi:hypothetical protein